MPAKKKPPTLRVLMLKTRWWSLSPDKFVLQEWNDTQNKYVDIPVVELSPEQVNNGLV